jgi:hypothetical protein
VADVNNLFLTYVMAAEDVVTHEDLLDFAFQYTIFLNEGLKTEGAVAQWCSAYRATRVEARTSRDQRRDISASLPLIACALGFTQRSPRAEQQYFHDPPRRPGHSSRDWRPRYLTVPRIEPPWRTSRS